MCQTRVMFTRWNIIQLRKRERAQYYHAKKLLKCFKGWEILKEITLEDLVFLKEERMAFACKCLYSNASILR